MSVVQVNQFLSIILIVVLIGNSCARKINLKAVPSSENETGPCLTEGCVWINYDMSKKMNPKMDPCKDFYEFVCGKNQDYGTPLELSSDMVEGDVFEDLSDKTRGNDGKLWDLVKDFYSACYTHDSNIEDLKKFINDIGGWPALDSQWKEKSFSLENFFTKSLKWGYNHNSLFTLDITAHPENVTRKVLWIRKANADSFDNIFPTENNMHPIYMRPSDRFDTDYVKILVKMFQMDESNAETSYDEYDSLRKNIQSVYARQKKEIMTLGYLTTLGHIKDKHCHIPWISILRAYVSPLTIYNDEPVIIDCIDCINALNELIGNTTKHKLANYLMWSLAIKTGLEIDRDNLLSNFPADTLASNSRYCAILTTYRFKRAIDHQYFKVHLNQNHTNDFIKIGEDIKNQMKRILTDDTNFDSETKANAIQKVNNTVIKVHWDEEIQTQEQVDAYYADLKLNIHPKSYFRGLLELTKFLIKKNLASLREPYKVYLEATSRNPTDYHYVLNTVLISASLGRTGNYIPKSRPNYVNFATVGFSFAKEISRAFDPWGWTFNAHGIPTNWWKAETKKKFEKTYSCFVKQYSQFINKETGNAVNGSLTLNSNVADNSGIYVAYKAYRNAKVEIPDQDLVDFKKYTQKQVFWIAAASMFCSKSTKKDVLAREKGSLTAENPIRVNGMMMNNADFAKDFACAPKTPMNPERKCQLWK